MIFTKSTWLEPNLWPSTVPEGPLLPSPSQLHGLCFSATNHYSKSFSPICMEEVVRVYRQKITYISVLNKKYIHISYYSIYSDKLGIKVPDGEIATLCTNACCAYAPWLIMEFSIGAIVWSGNIFSKYLFGRNMSTHFVVDGLKPLIHCKIFANPGWTDRLTWLWKAPIWPPGIFAWGVAAKICWRCSNVTMAKKPRSFKAIPHKPKDISAADTSATLQTWKYGCNDDIMFFLIQLRLTSRLTVVATDLPIFFFEGFILIGVWMLAHDCPGLSLCVLCTLEPTRATRRCTWGVWLASAMAQKGEMKPQKIRPCDLWINPVTPTKDVFISGTFSPGRVHAAGFNKELALQQKTRTHMWKCTYNIIYNINVNIYIYILTDAIKTRESTVEANGWKINVHTNTVILVWKHA